ncbi:MAG TPA: glycerol kinase GlpK [Candidatus Latescibacteria bacterium]|nr:glycerol kinase GlpK [Candidatus Latescibacterota bacterium]HQK22852.1 glycerol kinase GlpK [Candidatus Latescibacterota bacterium]HRU24284.1 glycerol kinase GlpK [Candidatus Latescibacterota bacterium]
MVLAIDQGTTSSRAIIFDVSGAILGQGYAELPQYYPQPGWVEHDPEEIWSTVTEAIKQALVASNVSPAEIKAVGVANQRETTIIWDRRTGKPIHRAIVWQCRRTSDICDRLRAEGWEEEIHNATGLFIDPYFSATKIRWLLDNVEGAQEAAEKGHLAFGTVDSWLLWKLSGGHIHATDYTNASRTLLFDIRAKSWNQKLLSHLKIPRSLMPQVKYSSVMYGKTNCPDVLPKPVTISGVAGDQQASLFGQFAYQPGQTKTTYGTGCFLLQHTGAEPKVSAHGLLATLAIDETGGPAYALEGAVFNAGSAVQWLRDGLQVITSSAESEAYAEQVSDTLGVYVVPAFNGLGAPYWNASVRGAMFGITRGTARHHIIRATLESIAYQTADVLDALAEDSGIRIPELFVDGKATQNNFLMQFQADIAGVPVVRPVMQETTVLGAALLAGIGAGVWSSAQQAQEIARLDRVFEPAMGEEQRHALRNGWRRAVAAATQF